MHFSGTHSFNAFQLFDIQTLHTCFIWKQMMASALRRYQVDAVWKTLCWVYWPDHTDRIPTFVWQTDCVENLILEECTQSRHQAQGVTHQICQQGSIFWSKCASFLIDLQDNDKINQVGRQGLLHRVHIKRHSKRTYLEWDFKWENCAQYFPWQNASNLSTQKRSVRRLRRHL